MLDVFLDALLDSLKVLAVVFIVNFALSFLEGKLATKMEKNNKLSPLIGASVGLIPQCGFSIVSVDLYLKNHITMGTLVAVFIACSDEALPIMISEPQKAIMILPLLLIKLVVGFISGFLIDLFIHTKPVLNKDEQEEIKVHTGCCHHSIEEEHHEDEKYPFLHDHILHPLVHSLKIFAYIFIVNMLFGIIIYYVGEDVISNFLTTQKWLTPLFSMFVGLIPNCASSVIITELFLQNSIPFAAALTGLCCNAGLGLIFLLKENKSIKNNLLIIGLLIAISLTTGYITLLIESLI